MDAVNCFHFGLKPVRVISDGEEPLLLLVMSLLFWATQALKMPFRPTARGR